MRMSLTPAAWPYGAGLVAVGLALACGGESSTTSPDANGGGGDKGSNGGNGGGTSVGSVVLWTRAASVLPLTIAAGTQDLGAITAAFTSPPACGASGAFTVAAPLQGQTSLTVYNLAHFGNAVVTLTPTSGCAAIEVQYIPATITVAAMGTGSGVVRSASGAIDCTITNGRVAATGCSVERTRGSTFTFRATPASGSTFGGYNGGVCPGVAAGDACNMSLDAQATTLTVTFDGAAAAARDTLWLGASWNRLGGTTGSGTVAAASIPLACTTRSPTEDGTCFALVPRGATVTITASPAGGATFVGWSQSTRAPTQCQFGAGPSCTITMRGPQTVPNGTEIAVGLFNPASPPPAPTTDTLSVQVLGTGGGSIQSLSPDGQLRCFKDAGSSSNYSGPGGSCRGTYPANTVVRLEAISTSADYDFTGWGGSCASFGKTPICSLTVGANLSVSATFDFGGGNGGDGGGGGGTFTPEPNSGTNVAACLSNLQKIPASQSQWFALPKPFDGVDYKIYWSSFFGVYEIIFRNRYVATVYFNFEPQGATVPTRTTYRDIMSAGKVELPPGVTVKNAQTGGRGCVLVNRVRFRQDTGLYQ